ncbi:MAG: hypothetical protein D6731_00130 [Planctomycetota bacterium]|nr:MAG: hypothetical protein D6731_00130 [Planctomycetota bacterium]
MHRQHTEWLAAIDAWEDDLRTWRVQHAKTLASLTRLSADLQRHGAGLLEHLDALRRARHEVRLHERELAELARAGAGDQADPLLAAHEEAAEKQAALGAAHEELKRKHRMVVAKLEQLLRDLEG